MDTLELRYASDLDESLDVCIGCSPFTFTDRSRTMVCKTSSTYPPGLECVVGHAMQSYGIRENMSKSSPSAVSTVPVLTALAHLAPRNTSELSSIWKSHDTRIENMKIRKVSVS